MMLGVVVFVLLACTSVHGQACSQVPPWFFPWGGPAGDIPYGPSPPASHGFFSGTLYNAFGLSDVNFNVKIFADLLTGRIDVTGVTIPIPSFGIHAAEAGGYDPDASTTRGWRKDLSSDDRDQVIAVLDKAFPCQDPHRIRVAFIATSVCLLKRNATHHTRTTYQVTMVSDGSRMYVILNYHMIHNWPGFKYQFEDYVTSAIHPFTGPVPDVADTLMTTTNGIQDGQWIFDITGLEPVVSDLGPCCPRPLDIAGTCSLLHGGHITTFDGANGNAPFGTKSVLARSKTGHNDECKFMVKVKTDGAGFVKWVRFSVGVHPFNNHLHKIHFFFNAVHGTVKIGGIGVVNHLLVLPYTWTDGVRSVTIEGDSTGWRLLGCPCDYAMTFSPDGGSDDVLYVYVGSYYEPDRMKAQCGNFNGDALDD